MAEVYRYPVPKSRYKGTVVCPKCQAEYNPKGRWVSAAYDPRSTSDRMEILGDIPTGVCLVCRFPRPEDKE